MKITGKTVIYFLTTPKRTPTIDSREQRQGHPEALKVLAMHDREIALYRESSGFFGYVFYVMRSRPIS